MATNLVIEVSDDLLQSIAGGGTVTVSVVRGSGSNGSAAVPAGAASAPARGAETRYRKGSHAAKLVEWATKRGKEFRTDEVVKALGVNRAHASMILTKLANDDGPVQRVARGVYRVDGGAAPSSSRTRRKKAARKKATAKRRTGRKKRATKKARTRRS